MFGNKKLIIRPICANLKRDTETFGKMDPYIIARVSEQTYKTKVAEDQGKHPVWLDVLEHILKDEDTELEIKVMEHDTISKDDFLGSITIPLAQIKSVRDAHQTQVCNIMYQGEVSGTVTLSLQVK